MVKSFACAALLSFVFLGQSMAAAGKQPDKAPSYRVPPLKISYGDLINVDMFGNPDLSGQFRVDSNGDIVVPLIGHVHVVGETADAVGTQISNLFVKNDILKPENAYATVSIAEFASQGITVNGEVKTPGIYPAFGVHMLNDVIAAAGGLTPTAASKVIITHRDDPGHPVTVTYNPEALHPTLPQVQILPGDSVLVPRAGIVYVVGDVMRSGGFVLDGRQPLTMEEAMALAGGGGKAAAMKRVQLVRTLKNGRKEVIGVSMTDIFKGKAPDLTLEDGDVVYVPTSNAKLVAEQALSAAVNIGSEVVIFKAAYY